MHYYTIIIGLQANDFWVNAHNSSGEFRWQDTMLPLDHAPSLLPPSYQNWAVGEPTDGGVCVGMAHDAGLQWKAYDCSEQKMYICNAS